MSRSQVLVRSNLAHIALTLVSAAALAACGETTEAPLTTADETGCAEQVLPIPDRPAAMEATGGSFGGSNVSVIPMEIAPISEEISSQAHYRPELEGMPTVGQDVSTTGTVDVYFSPQTLPKELTFPQFFEYGAVMYRWDPIEENSTSMVETMTKQFPEEVTPVQVGDFQGVLTWDDPMGDTEVRPHRVTWSASGFDFVVAAERPGEDVLNLARSIVC